MKMKQTYAIVLTSCMLVLGASCTNDDFNVNDQSAGRPITLKAAQAEAKTRVGHSDTEPGATDGIIDVRWKSGDAFALYASSTPETFTTDDRILGIASASVTRIRYRLRPKLHIPEKASLDVEIRRIMKG